MKRWRSGGVYSVEELSAEHGGDCGEDGEDGAP